MKEGGVRRKRGERAAASQLRDNRWCNNSSVARWEVGCGGGREKKGREGGRGKGGRERTHSKMLRVTFCPITYDQMWKKKNKTNTRNIMPP